MKHQKLYRLVLAALFAALTFVATNIIRVPIPATDGYINLGDCVVLLGAFLLGPVYGAAAGGIGSALADILSGYAVFAPGTFVICGIPISFIVSLTEYSSESNVFVNVPSRSKIQAFIIAASILYHWLHYTITISALFCYFL